jgi:hypothetical protein
MGLKFQREDSLDKMFDDFAFLPDNDKDNKKQEKDIERFLKNEPDDEKEQKKANNIKKAAGRGCGVGVVGSFCPFTAVGGG